MNLLGSYKTKCLLKSRLDGKFESNGNVQKYN